jgi:hypothetical protein
MKGGTMAFDQEVLGLLSEETRQKLGEITRIRQIAEQKIGIIETGEDDDLISEEGLTDLFMWNLAPIEAIAAIAHSEIAESNLVTADILMNDLRIKLRYLISVIERWLKSEMREAHLKSIEKNEAPAKPVKAEAEASR